MKNLYPQMSQITQILIYLRKSAKSADCLMGLKNFINPLSTSRASKTCNKTIKSWQESKNAHLGIF